MALLNAFMSTWTQARQTFGSGAPDPGAQFDASAEFRHMQSVVERAAPDERWQGTAAKAYAAVNADHGKVFGDLAELDVRLAAEIDNSARIVTAGRYELDGVRDRVVAAASSVPANQAGEAVMMSIVSSGLTQVSQIVQRANSELNAVGASIHKLSAEYRGLGNQKFGGRGPLPQQSQGSDRDPPYDPTPIVDAATWRVEWEKLRQEIEQYNRSMQDFGRRPVPSPRDYKGVEDYNREVARQQALRAELQRRQLEMVQKAGELGLPQPQITPPEGSSAQNALPSGFAVQDPVRNAQSKGLPL